MKSLKILFFLNSTAWGGVEEHVLSLIKDLDRNFFTPVLVCPAELAASFEARGPKDVNVYTLSLSSWRDMQAIKGFVSILREERPDIVHSHMFNASMFGSTISKLMGVRMTMETCHGPERWRKGWIKKSYLLDRFFKIFVDHFIAVSEAAGRHLTANKRVSSRKITVIWNGRDLDVYGKPPEGAGFPLPPLKGRVVVGVVGRLDGQKGHRYLIEAIPAIVKRHKDIFFVFVGDGALAEDLKGLAGRIGVSDFVHFAGHHPEVPWFLRQIDIFVLPSLYEGLPLVAIEASAAGLPVVATAVDGTPEVVLDGATGLLVPPADPVSLADAIVRLCEDEPLRKKMGRNARKRAHEEFSMGKQLQATGRLYLTLGERAGDERKQRWSSII